MLKKIIGMFMLVCVFAIASCGEQADNGGGGGDDRAAENGGNIYQADQADVSDDNGDAPDNNNGDAARPPSVLPDASGADFGGRTFRLVIPPTDHSYQHFIVEELLGEPINDALYHRNSRIEEMYNVTFDQLTSTGAGAARDMVNTSVLAGDDRFEMLITNLRYAGSLGSQGRLLDLFQVPYISESMELGNPWWDHALQRDLALFNQLFLHTGDLLMFDKLRLAVMYFNKDMFTEFGIEFPYHHVYAGTWTIDTVVELTRGINHDIDGDGIMGQHDRWGWMSEFWAPLHMFHAAGERSLTIDAQGVPQITKAGPRAVEVIQRALEISIDGETMFHANRITGYGAIGLWPTASAFFQENRFAMRSSVLEPVVRDLRAMPTDFGLLPYPKFNEHQENYYTQVRHDGWSVAIPAVADAEFAGFIIEALAYESGDTVMPAFVDLALTSQVLRDDESESMLHIIWGNRVYDIGLIFNIGILSGILHDMARDSQTDFVSRFERALPATEAALERFIDTYN